jgi:o-succinylbenzoate---CoA ligase
MMLVRALAGNLNLIVQAPSSNPLEDIPKSQYCDFMALSPLQLSGILKSNQEKLALVKTILIGGAALDKTVENEIQNLKTRFFHSYAMTETLTHVAVRAVNGNTKSSFYSALPGVSFSQDNRSCLVLKDEILGIDQLVTNDVVKLIDDSTFLWKGRYDNVINTGGIKIMPEEIELKINEILAKADLDLPNCLLYLPDAVFGEKMVLLVETGDNRLNKSQVTKLLRSNLPKYHEPKIIKPVPKIFLTLTGKIDRPKNRTEYLT